MMLQLNPTIDVITPLGNAEAIIVIDYIVYSVWLCKMKGGELKHFYSNDIKIGGNLQSPQDKSNHICTNCGNSTDGLYVTGFGELLCFDCFTKKYSCCLPQPKFI